MRVSGADFATKTVRDMLGVPPPGSAEVPPPWPRLPAPQHLPTTCVKSRHLGVSVCVRERDTEGLSTPILPLLLPQTCLPLWEQFRELRDFSERRGQALENARGSRHGVGVPGPWPQAPSAPAPMPGHVAPFKAGPRAASCTSHFPREKRAPGHGTVLPGAPWPLAPTPQGPRGLTVKEKKGATVGASHGPSCRGASRRWGRAVSVAELGSCASLPKARLAFIKGGGRAAAGPGPSPELAGQLEANRKVERKHRPRGAAHTHYGTTCPLSVCSVWPLWKAAGGSQGLGGAGGVFQDLLALSGRRHVGWGGAALRNSSGLPPCGDDPVLAAWSC